MALACAQLGHVDEAFEYVERLLAACDPHALLDLRNPLFVPLRAHPRFAGNKRQLGVA